MRWREGLRPVRMERVALVGPAERMDRVLDLVGRSGLVELDPAGADEPVAQVLAHTVPHGPVRAVLGWCPAPVLGELDGLAELGAALVPLPRPAGVEPPTLLAPSGAGRNFNMLVTTYATVPYRDIDPSLVAGVAYVVMFGMMFGDAGHGALLVIAGLLRPGPLVALRRLAQVWSFLVGAGVSAMTFGVLYGEFFGPTGCCRCSGWPRLSSRCRCCWPASGSARCCSAWPMRWALEPLARGRLGLRALCPLRDRRQPAVRRARPDRAGRLAGRHPADRAGRARRGGRAGAGLRRAARRVRRRRSRGGPGRGRAVSTW